MTQRATTPPSGTRPPPTTQIAPGHANKRMCLTAIWVVVA